MSVPDPTISGTSDSPDIEDGSEHERYPGPRSFSDSEVDQRLFFGREVETEELFHRVRANRLLVLFGKSGLGKTSLLQAGLYPKLRAHNLLPVPVRLNEPGVEPVTRVIDSVLDVCKVRGIDCEPGSRDGLWAFFKSMDMWHGDLLITPVLVFDQFEEIFTLQDAPFRRTLASELKDLSGRGLPPSVRDRRAAGERLTFSDTPPALHIILSLREEYVGSLEELVADVPAIFEHRFQLKAMGEDNARRAIVEPATIDESGIFTVPPFRFAVPALEAMLDFLKSRTGEIEPFQLQVLCQHVEREVATQQAKGVRDVSVDEHLLGGKAGLGKVLRNFYTYALRRLRKVHGHRQCRRAKQLCERALLNPDGRRVSVDEGSIHRQFKIKDDCFDTLIKTRLIRKETRPGLEGYYYELSHDSLALPIQEGRRRSRIQKTVMLLALFVFLFGYGIYVSLDYRALEEKTAQQLDNVALAAQLVEDARQLSEIGNINSALVKLPVAVGA